MNFRCFYTAADQQAHKPEQLLQAAIAEDRTRDEGWLVRKDGTTFWAMVTITTRRDEHGCIIGFSEVVRDLTEPKKAEEEIRTLNAELEQRVVERTRELEIANQELEAFSYSVSHDLRAPLRAIDGFSRILFDTNAARLDAEAARYLRLIRESTQQMGQLIDALLAFSRLSRQPLHKQTIAPLDLVHQALADLRNDQEGRRVDITIGSLPTCQADPKLLKQVWVNLLANALKFTRGRDIARIEVDCEQRGGEQVYVVRDNGVGFDVQYPDKLFGVFQRLHRAEDYEGSGVGLALVQRIIHRHGGRIWVEAEVDKGARFYFTLHA